ncbi:MAG: VacB/RNase II family 3'-5' exoribonuclease, partial [Pseudomonadota bacterium]
MARRKKIKDPHYQREAKKYPHPIPSREYIMDYLRQRGKPATRQELLKALHIEDDISKSALRRRLRAMERDGQLIFNRRGGYGLIEKMNLIKGRVIGHKEGYGFLVPEQEGEDLYLSAQQMKCVFDGDLVLARTSYVDKKGRLSGEIVEVLERAHDNIVGRYYSQSELGYVVPDNKRINQDIIVPPGKAGKAKSGDFVEVKIISPPTTRTQAIGEVKKHFGDPFTPGVEIDVALHAHAIPYEFPKSVKQAVAPLAKDPSEKDYRGRKDLRDKAFVTIDGEDAKDFDDAVYCEPKPRGGWMLYVAIADVSHYVKPGSALDEEAKLRGNSVYFPGRVIPMLPTALSNHLCSLRPNRDRLVLTCEMAISPTGKLTRYRFYEAVIFSQARLTYTKVAAMLVDNDANLSMRYKKVLPHLKDLKNLYDTLVQQRQDRGAIEFETIETKIE